MLACRDPARYTRIARSHSDQGGAASRLQPGVAAVLISQTGSQAQPTAMEAKPSRTQLRLQAQLRSSESDQGAASRLHLCVAAPISQTGSQVQPTAMEAKPSHTQLRLPAQLRSSESDQGAASRLHLCVAALISQTGS